jgi:hypothetical protein
LQWKNAAVPAGPTIGTGGGELLSTSIISAFGTAQNL